VKDLRDLRDPEKIGKRLLRIRQEDFPHKPFHYIVDVEARTEPPAPDYVDPASPVEKYGDPRLLPSTLPN